MAKKVTEISVTPALGRLLSNAKTPQKELVTALLSIRAGAPIPVESDKRYNS